MKTTGEKIQAFRKQMKLTQAELGKKIGVSGACIAIWESSRRIAGLDTIAKIAAALETNPISLLPDWFLFGGYE